jgi:hypothetical protein
MTSTFGMKLCHTSDRMPFTFTIPMLLGLCNEFLKSHYPRVFFEAFGALVVVSQSMGTYRRPISPLPKGDLRGFHACNLTI